MAEFTPQTLKPKQIELEAVRFTGGYAQAQAIIQWVKDNGGQAKYHFERVELQVSRDELALVSSGEWVVLKPDGSFDRWKHGRVTETYEVVYS